MTGKAHIDLNTLVQVLPDMSFEQEGTEYFHGDDLGVVTKLEGFQGEPESFQVTWDRTGLTSGLPFANWTSWCKMIGKAPLIELYMRVKALQGSQFVNGTTGDIKDFFRKGDLGTVTQMIGFNGEPEEFVVQWDSTGERSGMSKLKWRNWYEIVDKALEDNLK